MEPSKYFSPVCAIDAQGVRGTFLSRYALKAYLEYTPVVPSFCENSIARQCSTIVWLVRFHSSVCRGLKVKEELTLVLFNLVLILAMCVYGFFRYTLALWIYTRRIVVG